MGSLRVEETSAYCTVNRRASASNYQLSNMRRPARDSNRRPQRLEATTLTTTPPRAEETGTEVGGESVKIATVATHLGQERNPILR